MIRSDVSWGISQAIAAAGYAPAYLMPLKMFVGWHRDEHHTVSGSEVSEMLTAAVAALCCLAAAVTAVPSA